MVWMLQRLANGIIKGKKKKKKEKFYIDLEIIPVHMIP